MNTRSILSSIKPIPKKIGAEKLKEIKKKDSNTSKSKEKKPKSGKYTSILEGFKAAETLINKKLPSKTKKIKASLPFLQAVTLHLTFQEEFRSFFNRLLKISVTMQMK